MSRGASAYWLSDQIWTYQISPCRHKTWLSSAQIPHMLFRTQDNERICVCRLDVKCQCPAASWHFFLHIRLSMLSSSYLTAADYLCSLSLPAVIEELQSRFHHPILQLL